MPRVGELITDFVGDESSLVAAAARSEAALDDVADAAAGIGDAAEDATEAAEGGLVSLQGRLAAVLASALALKEALEAIERLRSDRSEDLLAVGARAATLGTDVPTADVLGQLAQRAAIFTEENIGPEDLTELVNVTRERIAGGDFNAGAIGGRLSDFEGRSAPEIIDSYVSLLGAVDQGDRVGLLRQVGLSDVEAGVAAAFVAQGRTVDQQRALSPSIADAGQVQAAQLQALATLDQQLAGRGPALAGGGFVEEAIQIARTDSFADHIGPGQLDPVRLGKGFLGAVFDLPGTLGSFVTGDIEGGLSRLPSVNRGAGIDIQLQRDLDQRIIEDGYRLGEVELDTIPPGT